MASRPPRIHHCTSEPHRFFGRLVELGRLDEALEGGKASVVAFVGPGGQGKTAIVQQWLQQIVNRQPGPAGLFFWSFYRGKDADLCLRELFAYAAGLARLPDVSASYCVDQLLPLLRREQWALILDGTEVAQYDQGSWRGRFLHPELGRLLEELASEPLPGVVVLTSRFDLPTLATRNHAQILSLSALDGLSARALLQSLGVRGTDSEMDEAASACGHHAKAVELLATLLVRFHGALATHHQTLPGISRAEGASEEEYHVAWVLNAYHRALSPEMLDILALATAFRDPPTESALLAYLLSGPVQDLLHRNWKRTYPTFPSRSESWLANQLQDLLDLRLLERVGRTGPLSSPQDRVVDAHPLVRRGFEDAIGPAGQRHCATARAGFLQGRPERITPSTLDQAREEIELFHAYCDAGLWNEADSAYRALDNPKFRFLAPALERDMLARFFPEGDWHRPPLWEGFGRYRSLAISLELLGEFAEALTVYRESDAALRGDCLLALAQLQPLLDCPTMPHPWQPLWQAYRCHALCLAGRIEEALTLARTLIPVDVYEWLHVFECLLRADQMDLADLKILQSPAPGGQHQWAELTRQRMLLDWTRRRNPRANLKDDFEALREAYDRAGLPLERCMIRLSYAAWLLDQGQPDSADALLAFVLTLAQPLQLRIIEADTWHLRARACDAREETTQAQTARDHERQLRDSTGYRGPARP